MTGRIYLLNVNSDFLAMEEAPCDPEKLVQEMLARHSHLFIRSNATPDRRKSFDRNGEGGIRTHGRCYPAPVFKKGHASA